VLCITITYLILFLFLVKKSKDLVKEVDKVNIVEKDILKLSGIIPKIDNQTNINGDNCKNL